MELNLSRYEYPEMIEKGFIFPISYSEIKTLPCSRKYAFKYIEGFSSRSYSRALSFGIAWHLACEYALNSAKSNDKLITQTNLLYFCDHGLMDHLREELKDKVFNEDTSMEEEIKSISEQIKLGIVGWLENWKKEIHPKFKVISVELPLCMPIKKGSRILRKKMNFIKHTFEDSEVFRLPISGECNDQNHSIYSYEPAIQINNRSSLDSQKTTKVSKQITFYKVGKLDCVVQDRETGGLWVLDHKTSGAPNGYRTKMRFNLQLQNYCSLLRHAIKEGKFDYLDNDSLFVEGVIWDIASSKYSPMQFDAKGNLKKSKRPIPPYHIVKEYVESNSLEDDYSDYLEFLKEKNESKYLVEFEMISESDLDRCEFEDLSAVQDLIIKRKKAESIDLRSSADLSEKIPRYTICETYNFCQFYINCFANTAMHEIQYKRQANLFWRNTL